MPDPGYGPNGERLDASGAISWQANGPPQHIPDDNFWMVFPLGELTIPYIDQDDDQVWKSIYLGGV